MHACRSTLEDPTACLRYDDRVSELYADLAASTDIPADGRHAHLERILETGRGVCVQHSRLNAELLRQAGIPCVEAHVFMPLQQQLTENDYHQVTMIPCPRPDGGVDPVIVEATGKERILAALLRQVCDVMRVPPPPPRTSGEGQNIDVAEPAITPAQWAATAPGDIGDVAPPRDATATDVRTLVETLGGDGRAELPVLVGFLHERCMRDPALFRLSSTDPARRELLGYFLAVNEAVERRFQASAGGAFDDLFRGKD